MPTQVEESEYAFKPFQPQQEFWQLTDREVLLSSGWGGGKSRILLEKLDYYTRRYPGTKALIARKTNSDLPGSTLEQYFTEVLPDAHIAEGPHKQEQWVKIHTPEGPPSKVSWGGLDRKEKYGSTEFGFIAVDEASELEHEDWAWLRGRLRRDDVGFHQIAGATNPPDEGKEHWMHPYFFDTHRPVVYCPPTENPHLPEDYMEDLLSLEGRLYKRFVEGKWVGASGTWLKRDMLTVVEATELEDKSLNWTVSVDLGIEDDPEKAEENDTDYWAAVIIAHNPVTQQAYLVDCTRQRGMDKATAATWLNEVMSGIPTNQARIEATHAQRWFLQECRDHGIQAVPVDHDNPKQQRLLFLSIPFSKEKVRLVNHEDPAEDGPEARWDNFVHEWTTFPGRHDDLLDATEMGLRPLNLGLSVQAYTGHAFGDK